jgi:exosortase A-associated hydrolase 1
MSEQAIQFACNGAPLVGILHRPAVPPRRGILIVVGGGPQYRVGGHRQLVLWSRRRAAEGYAVLRFDYTGMGDSYGTFRGYADIDADIRGALDWLAAEMPELEEFVLWGECDAASAILAYAYRDPRVSGLVLLNPFARTEAGQARAVLRHYYLDRLRQPSFWRKLLTLKFNPLTSLRSAWDMARRARKANSVAAPRVGSADALSAPLPRDLPLPERLLAGFTRFSRKTMIVMSGRDLYAREFDDAVRANPAWQQQLDAKQAVRHDLPEADHTFSSALWRDQVVAWSLGWLRSW